MKKYVLLFVSIFCLVASASSNNVRLDGVAKITEVNGGVATIELSLIWDNAWMDDNLTIWSAASLGLISYTKHIIKTKH